MYFLEAPHPLRLQISLFGFVPDWRSLSVETYPRQALDIPSDAMLLQLAEATTAHAIVCSDHDRIRPFEETTTAYHTTSLPQQAPAT